MILRRTLSSLGGLLCWLAASVPTLAHAEAPRYHVLRETPAVGPELVILRDEKAGVEAAVAPDFGAELTGLRCRFRGEWVELLYRARDYSPTDGWRGKAPILWPAVARNFPKDVKFDLKRQDCVYDYAGKRYTIPISGFVREMPWTVVRLAADDDSALLELEVRDTAETRAQYPFAFRLRVTYRLAGGRLEMLHAVQSDEGNAAPMFFSIGNHITFRTPLIDGSPLEQVLMQTPSTIEYLKDATTLPTGDKQPLSYVEPVGIADLKAVPAISLGGYTGDAWLRLVDPAGLAVRLSHHAESLPAEPLVQFNVWGRPRDGYLSPEPIVGLQNSLNLQQGLIELPAGRTWSWWLWIDLERMPLR